MRNRLLFLVAGIACLGLVIGIYYNFNNRVNQTSSKVHQEDIHPEGESPVVKTPVAVPAVPEPPLDLSGRDRPPSGRLGPR